MPRLRCEQRSVRRSKGVNSQQPLSSTSGVIRFLAKTGDMVKKGQPVAKIYDAFGELEETITAPDGGIILGHSDFSVAFPGVPVMAFGIF